MENRHFAVGFANIVAGLAPPVGGISCARAGEQQHQNGNDHGNAPVALMLMRGLALLLLLDLDGFGHLRVIGVGRQRAIGLLHDGNLTGIRRG